LLRIKRNEHVTVLARPMGKYTLVCKEIDMIQVRRTAEHDSFIFEVVVREGKGETRHHVRCRERCASG
jgi:hypothetical protein